MISIHRSLAPGRMLALGLAAGLSIALAHPAHATVAAPIVVVVEGSLVYEEALPTDRPPRAMRVMRDRSDLSCKRVKRGARAAAPPKSAAPSPTLGRR
jgi:hypothetical protein